MNWIGKALVIGAIAIAAIPSNAQGNEPPIDPRTNGLRAVRAWPIDTGVVRVERAPDKSPMRCVYLDRFEVPDEGGLQALEMGVTRTPNGTNAEIFFRLRYLARRDGPPLAIQRPTMQFYATGPTRNWEVAAMDRNGWVRVSQRVDAVTRDEWIGFNTAVEKGAGNLVFTLPNGEPKLVQPRGGPSQKLLGMFTDCFCKVTAELPPEVWRGYVCR